MDDSPDDLIRIIKWSGLACAAVAVLVTIVFFLWWGMKDYLAFGQSEFDRTVWITAKPSPDNRCFRGEMALDIQKHLLQPGLTRKFTEELLGKPNFIDSGHAEYELGYCGFAVHGLRLFFDKNNRLIYSRIAQY